MELQHGVGLSRMRERQRQRIPRGAVTTEDPELWTCSPGIFFPAVGKIWKEPFKSIAQQSRPEVEEQTVLPHFKGTSSPQELCTVSGLIPAFVAAIYSSKSQNFLPSFLAINLPLLITHLPHPECTEWVWHAPLWNYITSFSPWFCGVHGVGPARIPGCLDLSVEK